ncbi:hypothetical protein [Bowmanella denitrificans]
MQCSVFIATSADGYIATPDGGVKKSINNHRGTENTEFSKA